MLFKNGGNFLQYEVKDAMLSDFKFRDLPPGDYWLEVFGKSKQETVGANTFWTNELLSSRQLTIKPGDAMEVNFTELDKKPEKP